MPVPSVTHTTKRWPAPAPNRLSPSAEVLRVVVDDHRDGGSGWPPGPAAARCARPGAARTSPSTGWRRRSRRRRSRPPRRRAAARAPGPARRSCPRPPATSWPSVGAPLLLDDGAARSRRPRPGPWCRRCRCRWSAGPTVTRARRLARVAARSEPFGHGLRYLSAGPGRRRRSARPGCRAGPCGSRAPAGGPRPVSWRRNAARTGSSSRSPASLTPPPITTTAGSRTAVSEAMPSPSQRPSVGQLLDRRTGRRPGPPR